jgi:2-C-methyl-D-erythritol 4-phosphate cytidylyltransferase
MSRVGVIIPAGGAGRRMGDRPKAELLLLGRPMLELVVEPFLNNPDVVEIVIALPEMLLDSTAISPRDRRIKRVVGGEQRQDSVRAGLRVLRSDADVVLVHDAARPLVTAELIARVIGAVEGDGIGAVAALPASDTIHEAVAGRDAQTGLRNPIRRTLDRRFLWQAQTPQGFPRLLLEQAHEKAAAEGFIATDEAALLMHYGGAVTVVTGDRSNIKITVPEDIVIAEAILAHRQ